MWKMLLHLHVNQNLMMMITHQFQHVFWVLKRTMRRFFLSTHNIGFGRGIRKMNFSYTLLSGGLSYRGFTLIFCSTVGVNNL